MASDYMKHRVQRLRELAEKADNEGVKQELTLAANALQTMIDQLDGCVGKLREARKRN